MKNPNFIKASNLIFITAALALINFYILTPVKSSLEMMLGVITVVIVSGLAFLVRKAYKWIKWLFLILAIPGFILSAMSFSVILQQDIPVLCNTLLQAVLQIIAIILMFLPNKSASSKYVKAD